VAFDWIKLDLLMIELSLSHNVCLRESTHKKLFFKLKQVRNRIQYISEVHITQFNYSFMKTVLVKMRDK
jgi:hypothetical protein